jgi:lipoyl(octanoyl) transferase
MQRFTDERSDDTVDEMWFVEHPPIFTLGLNADPAHVHHPGRIPVVRIDRGGQVTYHGPGQLVVYTMLDLRRLGLGVRDLVEALEGAVVDLAAAYDLHAYARREAHGVYVGGRKLAAVGLRIRRHASYHGIAINVSMDLEPFHRIDPCGFEGLEVTQLRDLCGIGDLDRVRRDIEPRLLERLGCR